MCDASGGALRSRPNALGCGSSAGLGHDHRPPGSADRAAARAAGTRAARRGRTRPADLGQSGVVAVVPSAADPRERRWLDGPRLGAETFSESGVAVAEKACAAIWTTIHIPLRHFNVPPCADAAPTVARLAARGFRIGIVTARPLPAALVLRDLRDQGLPEVFEVVVTSGEVGLAKPHPGSSRSRSRSWEWVPAKS